MGGGERTPDTYWIVPEPKYVRMKALRVYEDRPAQLNVRVLLWVSGLALLLGLAVQLLRRTAALQ